MVRNGERRSLATGQVEMLEESSGPSGDVDCLWNQCVETRFAEIPKEGIARARAYGTEHLGAEGRY